MNSNTENTREQRIAFAKTLTEFDEQRSWYSSRSGQFKSRAQKLDLFVILCGALIVAVPILKPGSELHWSEIIVATLGVMVVLGQGSMRIYRYAEIWPEYRQASERMKREWRLFINASGTYAGDEDEAQKLYVNRLESIIAEEQNNFFEQHQTAQKPNNTESPEPTSS